MAWLARPKKVGEERIGLRVQLAVLLGEEQAHLGQNGGEHLVQVFLHRDAGHRRLVRHQVPLSVLVNQLCE